MSHFLFAPVPNIVEPKFALIIYADDLSSDPYVQPRFYLIYGPLALLLAH